LPQSDMYSFAHGEVLKSSPREQTRSSLYRPVSVTLTMAGVAVASFRICAASLSKSSCVCAPLGLGDGWYWSFTTMPVGDAGDPWVTLLVLPPLLVRGAVPLLPPLDMYKYAIAMRINPNTIATT